jgi:hypothetical protein
MTSVGNPSQLNWRRSSQCSSDACVEVAILDNQVFVRGLKNIDNKTLVFDGDEWKAFLAGARNYEFEMD